MDPYFWGSLKKMKNQFFPLFPLLLPWSAERQKVFLQTLPNFELANGQIVFQKGENSTDVYFILKGRVKSLNYNQDGKMSFFRSRGMGECFGFYSAISGESRTANMIVEEDLLAKKMKGNDFLEFITHNPDIAKNVLKLIVGLLRIETDRLNNLITESASHRLIAELVSLAHAQCSHKLILPERNDFASYLGMTRETLSRELGCLVKKKIIRIFQNEIEILDWENLNKFFQPD